MNLTRVRNLTALAAVALPALGALSAAPAETLDCRTASLEAETIICTDARLSALDQRFGDLFYHVMEQTPRVGERRRIYEYRMQFLATRNGCVRDVPCIREAYLDQIETLERRMVKSHSANAH